jgi:hypothetical protein
MVGTPRHQQYNEKLKYRKVLWKAAKKRGDGVNLTT